METVKIFIGSTLDALPLASVLKKHLNTDISEAFLGQKEIAVEQLKQITKSCDFAVICLTWKDISSQEVHNTRKQQERDNRIFEAGLFMGALGRDRCFLVTNVRDEDLPVDLRMLTYLGNPKLKELEEPIKCLEAAEAATLKILESAQALGRLTRHETLPLLSLEDIFERERMAADGGGLQQKSTIVICDLQPVENFQNAFQIRKNLKHKIKYYYFFPANDDGAMKICRLLQMILLSDLDLDKEKEDSFAHRQSILAANKEPVLRNLYDICIHNRLKIYFDPFEPAFQYRIHNADSPRHAKSYIKYGTKHFLDWLKGGNAHSIWGYMERFADPKEKGKVFCWNVFYNPNEEKIRLFRNSLDEGFRVYFPEIEEKVKKLCFGPQ